MKPYEHARREGQVGDGTTLTEESILADIRYFESRLQALANPDTSYERAMQRVYASLLAHRRQVLAAWRDGRPEAWYEYEHVLQQKSPSQG
ncbi:MAG TPA: hypothetical protein VNL72_02860 [Gammaproteobacteria bacterium]|nr:hypothetical protein [Gammaproteobacteria bacterium]